MEIFLQPSNPVTFSRDAAPKSIPREWREGVSKSSTESLSGLGKGTFVSSRGLTTSQTTPSYGIPPQLLRRAIAEMGWVSDRIPIMGEEPLPGVDLPPLLGEGEKASFSKQDLNPSSPESERGGGGNASTTFGGANSSDSKSEAGSEFEEGVNPRTEGREQSTEDLGRPRGLDGEPLDDNEIRLLESLKRRDAAVHRHEQAHIAVGRAYIQGGANYTYAIGPDGRRYAVGGEVSIDMSKERTPEETAQKMRMVRAAALAPADPSPQDRRVAAIAAQRESQARLEILMEERREGENQEVSSSVRKNKSPQQPPSDMERTRNSKGEVNPAENMTQHSMEMPSKNHPSSLVEGNLGVENIFSPSTEGEERVRERTEGAFSREEGGETLSPREEAERKALQRREEEIREHEEQHLRFGAEYAIGGVHYQQTIGPDGRWHPVHGRVQVDISPEYSTEATIDKLEAIRRSASAPNTPSGGDLRMLLWVGNRLRQLRERAREEIDLAREERQRSLTEFARRSEETSTTTPDSLLQETDTLSRRKAMQRAYEAATLIGSLMG